MLKLKSVDFIRAGRQILSDVNLSVSAGEIVGVIGKNGAGKSTLAGIISGLIAPSRGQVMFQGRDIKSFGLTELSQSRAYLSQSFSEGMGLTVMDVLLMARHSHRPLQTSDYEVLDEMCDAFDLWKFLDRPLATLSGGERQKVLFAKSLAQLSPFDKERLLVLDEPTASLDLEVQQHLLRTTQRLAQSHGVGVVLILHDLNQAAAYCDKLCVLYEGELVLEGSAASVMTEENLQKYFKVSAKVTFQNNLPMLTI